MSKEFNKRMYSEFETDVCIKIKSPHKFIQAISVVLKNKANFVNISPVKYCDRVQKYGEHNEYHPSMIKENRYKNQNEVRALWQLIAIGNINPLFINLQPRHVRRYCEIFHVE